jgi:hypothetical protein
MKDLIASFAATLPVRTARIVVVLLLLGGLPLLYGMDRRITAQENVSRMHAARVEMLTEATHELSVEVRKLRELLAERALDRSLDRRQQ